MTISTAKQNKTYLLANAVLRASLSSDKKKMIKGKAAKFLSVEAMDEIIDRSRSSDRGGTSEGSPSKDSRRRARDRVLEQIRVAYGIGTERKGDEGYWLLDTDRFVLDVGTAFSDGDLALIAAGQLLAQRLLPHVDAKAGDVLEKLKTLFPGRISEDEELVSRTSLVHLVSTADEEKMATVDGAISKKKRISFSYSRPLPRRDCRKEEAESTVEEISDFSPYTLYFAWRSWYVLGKKKEGGSDLVSYNLNLMGQVTQGRRAVEETDRNLIEKALQSALLFLPGPGEGMKDRQNRQVTLEVGPPFAESVRRTRWPDHVTVSEEGSEERHKGDTVSLSFRLSNPYEVLPLVFEYAPWSKVIEPEDLRNCVIAFAGELLKHNLELERQIDWTRSFFDLSDMTCKALPQQEVEERER